ncbi:DUF1566 domain-containing protein [Vibrio taketomensis]|uniref:Lcl C-terminal domain-containing protein n=1 Tax=Vibrio taketomensis TaxID=2572923 RepID=UPI0013897BF5|nr:DUF1566 domain-containing protein [Vibrio taketomensis]
MKSIIYGLGLASMSLLVQPVLAQQVCLDNAIPTTPTTRFVMNKDSQGAEDGTVTDTKTGLMWMRCSVGQKWDAANRRCTEETLVFSWQQALVQAESYRSGPIEETGTDDGVAAYDDWRLPNVKELASIIESTCSLPAINVEVFFIDMDTDIRYWSSSPTLATLLVHGRRFLFGHNFDQSLESEYDRRILLVPTVIGFWVSLQLLK